MRSYEVAFTIEGKCVMRANNEQEALAMFHAYKSEIVKDCQDGVSTDINPVEEEEPRKPVFERTRRTPL